LVRGDTNTRIKSGARSLKTALLPVRVNLVYGVDNTLSTRTLQLGMLKEQPSQPPPAISNSASTETKNIPFSTRHCRQNFPVDVLQPIIAGD